MDRYKFRAWDKKKKEMFPVHALEWHKISHALTECVGFDDHDKDGWTRHGGGNMRYANGDRYILMQDTGLKDIEQYDTPRELYTHDIVKMHQFLFDGTEYENEIVGVLEYDNDLACVCLIRIKQDDIKKYMGYDDQEEFESEKIPVCTIIGLHDSSWTYLGNIHDNPELLETSK